jgi:hypothetical protein
LKGKHNLRSSKCSKYKCKIKADNITSKSSGSTISMEGLALGLETIASSGSTINANELLAK